MLVAVVCPGACNTQETGETIGPISPVISFASNESAVMIACFNTI